MNSINPCGTVFLDRASGKPAETTQNRKHVHHYNTSGHAHELTFSCYRRLSFFNDENACQIFLDTLANARKLYSFRLWAYVLMPNHVHLLIWPLAPKYEISKILSGLKAFTSKTYRKFLEQKAPMRTKDFLMEDGSFQFWQPGPGFDRNLWNGKAIHDSINYIEENPVRKQLADKPEIWKWSSAYARKNQTGVIPDKYDMPVLLPNAQAQRIGKM